MDYRRRNRAILNLIWLAAVALDAQGRDPIHVRAADHDHHHVRVIAIDAVHVHRVAIR